MSDEDDMGVKEVPSDRALGSFWEILGVATRLGLTSFGGPIAHLGYFHEEYVKRRRWIDEQTYADLMALCQFLPPPHFCKAMNSRSSCLYGDPLAWMQCDVHSPV